MSTIQQAEPVNYSETVLQLVNPTLLSRATEIGTEQRDIDKALRIASVLQTTLELPRLIELFAAEVGRLILIGSVTYQDPERTGEIRIGTPEKQAIAYRLNLAGADLGTITFTRKRRFSGKENSALDYLLCGLIYALRNALEYRRVSYAALKDPLTGAGNRAALDSAMLREVELSRRHQTPLSLIALDLDHFKSVNDTHGHTAGDCVLKAVTQTIRDTVRLSDMVFRYGGEEFMILLSNTGRPGASQLAERIRQRVEQAEIICHGAHIKTTASLGIACLGLHDAPSQLLHRADQALYRAKAAGRNRVQLAEDDRS